MEFAMAKMKRHSKVEIASKLAQANDLMTQGKMQSDIARTLRVSVMTLHRWRKALAEPQPASAATHQGRQPHLTDNDVERIAELQVENSRLRRLVTDLLLEKMTLAEAASSHEASLEGSNSALRK
jgi:putative transposase